MRGGSKCGKLGAHTELHRNARDLVGTENKNSTLNHGLNETAQLQGAKPTIAAEGGESAAEKSQRVVIIGAGPAGLTAAYELAQRGVAPLVLEKGERVGGIARTEEFNGYRFDIGGHRFYTKVEEIAELWRKVLKEDFRRVPRLSRIFYNGKFFDYPLSLSNTLSNLGAVESFRILLSYFRSKVFPYRDEETFAHWVTNRFGDRLYRTFFKTYTEKVWGISCDEIQAEWAAQRIRGLSLSSAIFNALFRTGEAKSLIREFDYPEFGPGQMWERFAYEVESRNGQVKMGCETIALRTKDNRVTEILVRDAAGKEETISGEQFISTMPINELLHRLEPHPPLEVREAAAGLKYRALILVGLIVKREKLFPDNWIYIHAPGVRVGRIQNFKNWSASLVPDANNSSLGMEYFCSEGDAIWDSTDDELLELAAKELVSLGLAKEDEVQDGVVIRQPKAYPVYDAAYRGHLDVIRPYLAQFENFQTIGRNGMHRYNNQDHSMLTGLIAARHVLGDKVPDIWEVNVERSYYEEFSRASQTANSPA